jgi:hypothetical protein
VSDLVSFAVVFVVLVILAVFTNIISLTGIIGDTDLDAEYQIEGVTRFQGCDITLLNLLQTQVPTKTYTFGDAIALDEIGALSDADTQYFTQESNKIINKMYSNVDVAWKSCASIKNSNEQFCSQKVPGFDGGCIDVRIIKK